MQDFSAWHCFNLPSMITHFSTLFYSHCAYRYIHCYIWVVFVSVGFNKTKKVEHKTQKGMWLFYLVGLCCSNPNLYPLKTKGTGRDHENISKQVIVVWLHQWGSPPHSGFQHSRFLVKFDCSPSGMAISACMYTHKWHHGGFLITVTQRETLATEKQVIMFT